MSKTILIGMNNKFSANANKWLFSLNGLIFLTNGAFNVYTNKLEPIGMILGVLMLAGGIYSAFYGIFGFSESSKFASKVKVDESVIELKNSLWVSATKLNWSDLSSITFQPYEMIFELKGTSNSFSYSANADVSTAIKKTIREFAKQKNVQIIGG